MRWPDAMSSPCCRPAAASRSASNSPPSCATGLTVVVSPLIALMKDQVDALTATGIPATFLNSTLDGEEARARFRGLHRGELPPALRRPERLMLPGLRRQRALRGTSRNSPSTKRIASANGATISARNTASSPTCATPCPRCP